MVWKENLKALPGLVLLAAIVASASCTGSSDAPAPAAQKTASIPAEKPVYDQALRPKIGEATVLADLLSSLTLAEAQALANGARSTADGNPLTVILVMDNAHKRQGEIDASYGLIVDALPSGDLRNAVKEDWAATTRFLRLFEPAMADSGWSQRVSSAQAERDRTRSRLETEEHIAFR